MKTLLVLSLCLLALVSPTAQLASSQAVTLSWNYPASQITPDLFFKVYSTTNLTQTLTNWPVLAVLPGTNTSYATTLAPGARYFAITSSNFWGEGFFSVGGSNPPPPMLRNPLGSAIALPPAPGQGTNLSITGP